MVTICVIVIASRSTKVLKIVRLVASLMCRETWIMPPSHLKYMLSRAQYEEKEKRNGKRKAARSDDSREVVRVSPDKRHRRGGRR